MREWMRLFEEREEYAYHATFARNIPEIQQHGLVPDREPNFDFTRVGRLYASSEDGARWYADELGGAYEEEMVILRFPMPSSVQADEYGNTGDFWFRDPIPASEIEIESEAGGRYVPLGDYHA